MTKEFNPIVGDENVIEYRDAPVFNDITELDDIFGLISTVSSEPTYTPTKLSQQIKIYKNGSTRRFYWYDTINKEWVYVAGTAV